MTYIAKEPQVSKSAIKTVVHQGIRHKSYVMRNGQFISAKTKKTGHMRPKQLLNKLKSPHEHGKVWFYSDEKHVDPDQ